MAEQISKLSPHRDLQCYYFQPSAIAALSQASASGFTLSGKWRQQFDWAVVEWNRDNVFEHPSIRNLPDGDLSGLKLSYQEQRTGCIPIESNLYPVVSWNKLRIWVPNTDGSETIYYVDIASNAKPVGQYTAGSATMTFLTAPAPGDRVGLAWLNEHYYYQLQGGEDLQAIASALAANINSISETCQAVANGPSIALTLTPRPGSDSYSSLIGENGNRLGVYGFVSGSIQAWAQPFSTFSGGQFPAAYEINLDFSDLQGTMDAAPTSLLQVPTKNVRKLRWTWSADLQAANYQQTEFCVQISNWSVTGQNQAYQFAGPGSRRIEDADPAVTYNGTWTTAGGNFSGSQVTSTLTSGDTCTINYTESGTHQLYLGTRRISTSAPVAVSIDGTTPYTLNLALPGEDVLIRLPLGTLAGGTHTVQLQHSGITGVSSFYFDFLEIAYAANSLPEGSSQPQLALATDWDTLHSQALPAERTAWLIQKLGFRGRVNHYVGALAFYELVRPGMTYASTTIEVTMPGQQPSGTASGLAELEVDGAIVQHQILPDETSETLAIAFASLINAGSNAVWASASGSNLTITARAMGTAGNGIVVTLAPDSTGTQINPVSSTLNGGSDGIPYDLDLSDPLNQTLVNTAALWRTDLNANPRINRAARDWHRAYFAALKGYGLDVVAAFSTEMLNADPSSEVGIAQRYLDGTPVVLNTPAIQTNFSPVSLAFWKQTYLDMAGLQNAAGLVPYLQSGEVQWWYFPKLKGTTAVGMTFYDDYTQQEFQSRYGAAMQSILSNTEDPSNYPNEVSFLPTLIGAYTAAIRDALRAAYPNCRYEVLYPTDTNHTPLNELINYPSGDWMPGNLTCLKTESFSFTAERNLDLSTYSMNVSAAKGFSSGQRSHLVGIGDATTVWPKEMGLAQSQGLESVVLFALDQFCLIGYGAAPFMKNSSSRRQA
jgi:hypothetical protein